MEKMTVRILECRPALAGEGVSALVIAFSEASFGNEPAVRVLMRLRLPEGATSQDAYDLALKYLDPV